MPAGAEGKVCSIILEPEVLSIWTRARFLTTDRQSRKR